MNTDLKLKLEFKKMVFRYVQGIRCSKARPDLARFASTEEIELKAELDQLEKELAATQQPELLTHKAAA